MGSPSNPVVGNLGSNMGITSVTGQQQAALAQNQQQAASGLAGAGGYISYFGNTVISPNFMPGAWVMISSATVSPILIQLSEPLSSTVYIRGAKELETATITLATQQDLETHLSKTERLIYGI